MSYCLILSMNSWNIWNTSASEFAMKYTCRVIEDERESLTRRYARLSLIHSCPMLLACILYLHCVFLLLLFFAYSSLDSFFLLPVVMLCIGGAYSFFHPMISFRTLVLRFGMVSAVPAARACTFHFFSSFIHWLPPHCKKDTAKIWYEKRHLERILCNKLN